MNQHLNIKISGQVQGVFFRSQAQEVAEGLGIKGFAQNLEDGTVLDNGVIANCVYIEVEGKEGDLEKFLAWCHQGPALAKIEKVEVTKGRLKNFPDFQTF